MKIGDLQSLLNNPFNQQSPGYLVGQLSWFRIWSGEESLGNRACKAPMNNVDLLLEPRWTNDNFVSIISQKIFKWRGFMALGTLVCIYIYMMYVSCVDIYIHIYICVYMLKIYIYIHYLFIIKNWFHSIFQSWFLQTAGSSLLLFGTSNRQVTCTCCACMAACSPALS